MNKIKINIKNKETTITKSKIEKIKKTQKNEKQ